MTPQERFDRLFNRIMEAAGRQDSAEVERFTPMALGAYQQLESRNADSRYHAAVLHLQVGNFAAARALADTILSQSPAHLFGYVVRGEVAKLQGDSEQLGRANVISWPITARRRLPGGWSTWSTSRWWRSSRSRRKRR